MISDCCFNTIYKSKTQVGFTTPQDRGRTGNHSTDLAKMVGSPVIHVNGDSPEVR